MTEDDWGNDFGRAVALFVNGEGIRERGQYGQRHVDTRSCSASTPTTRRSSSPCPGRSTARSGRGSSRPPSRRPDDADRRRGRRADQRCRTGPSSCWTGRSDMTATLRHLPGPGPPRLRPGRHRRARRLPGRPRRQPPLHRAAADRRARLRRTATTWSTTGRSTRRWAARPGRLRAGRGAARARPRPGRRHRAQPRRRRRAGGQPGLVGRAAARPASRAYAHWFDIDWDRGPAAAARCSADDPDALDDLRVEDGELRYYDHRFPIAAGTGDGTPARGARPAALRAGRLAARRHRAQLPPVLRDRRPGRRCGSRTRRSSTPPTPRCCAGTPPATCDGIRVDHPDGLRDPAGYLRRLRDRRAGRLAGGGEDPRAGRGAAGLAGGRHHRLRRAGRGLRRVRRPGRRGVLRPRSTTSLTGARDVLGRTWCTPASTRSRPRCSPPSWPGWPALVPEVDERDRGRWPSWPPASRSTARYLPHRRPAPGRGAGPRPAAAGPT